jgi:FixJ family two-component response regulator
VLDRIVDGKPNKIVAADLKISQRTVEHHRGALMRKLRVRSLAGLIRLMLPLRA